MYGNIGSMLLHVFCRVDPVRRQVELSLRLSHTDPTAAKRERRKADKERARGGGKETETRASSDEESDRYRDVCHSLSRYTYGVLLNG